MWKSFSLLTILLLSSSATVLFGQTEAPDPRQLEGAVETHFDLFYLPDRETGMKEDRFVQLDVQIPAGDGPFPAIIFLHGGGGERGNKNGLYRGQIRTAMERALDSGYVVVNLGHMLNHTGHGASQRSWDVRSAIRFLRHRASQFQIDPARIGAWGFSAGGTIITTTAMATAGDVREHPAPPEIAASGLATIEAPYDDPRPEYETENGRLTAIVADSWSDRGLLTKDDPAILTYIGTGGRHKTADIAESTGADIHYLELTGEDFAGKGYIHVPPLDSEAVWDEGNATGTVEDAVFAWLDKKLKNQPRTVPPEARPNRRWVTPGTEVHLIPASEDTAIIYTLDGSEPDTTSPRYTEPIVIDPPMTIRAKAKHPDQDASEAVTFEYVKASNPARLVPKTERLPPGKVGEPYEFQFEVQWPREMAATPSALLFHTTGHLMTERDRRSGEWQNDSGLSIEPRTGLLSGTPEAAGAYTFQVQAIDPKSGQVDARDYLLVIERE